MTPWFNPAPALADLLRAAGPAAGFDDSFAPDVRPADPRHGDFQANGVLPWAKAQRSNPRAAAQKLLDAVSPTLPAAWVSVEIAGPGFLNFRLTPAFLLAWLETYRDEASLAEAARAAGAPRTCVVDFSSPNTAKEMHIGHLRSTVIGEAVCRLVAFSGARVIRDNHIGDWGTQFGLILLGLQQRGVDPAAFTVTLSDIEQAYRETTAAAEADPAVRESARQELVRLQQGDPDRVALWRAVTRVSYEAFEQVYQRLGVHFDHVLGESFYNDQLEAVCQSLQTLGLATESDGALVVFHPEHPRFAEQPFIIRKRDGASNYATTDLATMRYRVEHFAADEVIIITDARQVDHFQQLELTTRKWFERQGWTHPRFRHLTFGSVLGEDNRPIKTRAGGTVKLREVLDDAVERARAVVAAKNPDLAPAEQAEVARVVGLGAVKYADLMQNRSSDYVFAWDRLLSFDGNTAPYLLYAVARLHSIFRKVEQSPGAGESGATAFETATEVALARQLLGFVHAVEAAQLDLRPHFLCAYLYDLAGTFSTFYNADRVAVDDPAVRARRLLLCARTLRTLEAGLHLLGLETVERM